MRWLIAAVALVLLINTGSSRPIPRVDKDICPSGCTCEESFTVIKCLEKNLENIPLFSFAEKIISLDLSQNKIKKIHRNDLGQFSSLKTLNLQNNKIKDIHPDAFKSIPQVETLYLSNNPYECSCKSLKLVKHLKILSTRISDIDQMTCTDGPDNVQGVQMMKLVFDITSPKNDKVSSLDMESRDSKSFHHVFGNVHKIFKRFVSWMIGEETENRFGRSVNDNQLSSRLFEGSFDKSDSNYAMRNEPNSHLSKYVHNRIKHSDFPFLLQKSAVKDMNRHFDSKTPLTSSKGVHLPFQGIRNHLTSPRDNSIKNLKQKTVNNNEKKRPIQVVYDNHQTITKGVSFTSTVGDGSSYKSHPNSFMENKPNRPLDKDHVKRYIKRSDFPKTTHLEKSLKGINRNYDSKPPLQKHLKTDLLIERTSDRFISTQKENTRKKDQINSMNKGRNKREIQIESFGSETPRKTAKPESIEQKKSSSETMQDSSSENGLKKKPPDYENYRHPWNKDFPENIVRRSLQSLYKFKQSLKKMENDYDDNANDDDMADDFDSPKNGRKNVLEPRERSQDDVIKFENRRDIGSGDGSGSSTEILSTVPSDSTSDESTESPSSESNRGILKCPIMGPSHDQYNNEMDEWTKDREFARFKIFLTVGITVAIAFVVLGLSLGSIIYNRRNKHARRSTINGDEESGLSPGKWASSRKEDEEYLKKQLKKQRRKSRGLSSSVISDDEDGNMTKEKYIREKMKTQRRKSQGRPSSVDSDDDMVDVEL